MYGSNILTDPAGSRADLSDIEGDPYGPGSDQLYLNLANQLFDKPMGLALIIHDMENDAVGGVYLEYVLAQAHNMTISSGQTIVAENVSLRIGKVRPIKLGTLIPGAEIAVKPSTAQ